MRFDSSPRTFVSKTAKRLCYNRNALPPLSSSPSLDRALFVVIIFLSSPLVPLSLYSLQAPPSLPLPALCLCTLSHDLIVQQESLPSAV